MRKTKTGSWENFVNIINIKKKMPQEPDAKVNQGEVVSSNSKVEKEEKMANLAQVFLDDTMLRNSLKLLAFALLTVAYLVLAWSIIA